VQGFKFTSQSKQQLIEGLVVAVQQQQIKFPSGIIADEMRNFEFEYTRTGVRYTAPTGLHDDAVCGLASCLGLQTTQQERSILLCLKLL
jgi:hypothetical protein